VNLGPQSLNRRDTVGIEAHANRAAAERYLCMQTEAGNRLLGRCYDV
jgi:hypothetical protein